MVKRTGNRPKGDKGDDGYRIKGVLTISMGKAKERATLEKGVILTRYPKVNQALPGGEQGPKGDKGDTENKVFKVNQAQVNRVYKVFKVNQAQVNRVYKVFQGEPGLPERIGYPRNQAPRVT